MKAVTALSALLPLAAAKVNYDGYKAFHIDSADNYEAVRSALSDIKHVSLSCESNHKSLDVAIAPESMKAFKALNLDSKVISNDLGAEMAMETFKPYVRATTKSGAAAIPDESYFESYHSWEEHGQFLEDLAGAFPDNSESFVAGQSLEGRDMRGIHLYGSGGPGKSAIVWHGNVHAREWITSMTVEYMAWKIVTDYQNGDTDIVSTLDNYDFYILPIVNPDGFVYTIDEDRMWRKNRQERSGESCVGTDVNRNWPYQWDVDGGSSPDPCDETFRGEAEGDTPEMAVLTNHTMGISESQGIKYFVDWHSFSQLILLPYGYSCSAEVGNLDKQMSLGKGVAEGIASVNGLEFVYGPTCETIYQAAGSSMDWATDVANAEIAWGFELRPSSGGGNGFVLTPDNIIPSGEENYAGMKWLFNNF